MNGTRRTIVQPSASPRHWCFRNRRLHKVVLLVLLVLVLGMLVLALCTFIRLHQDNGTTVIPVTTETPGSVHCDDIYDIECNNWTLNNPTPPNRHYWTTFSKVNLLNIKELSNIFENARYVQFESQAEEKAKQFYLSCTDVNGTIEALGKQPIIDLIDKVGGWNISSYNTSTTFTSSTFTSVQLQERMETMKNCAGVDSFFYMKIIPDDVYTKNNSNYILKLFPLERPPGYSSENYQNYMVKIAQLLQDGDDKDAVAQQVKNIFSFYKTLLESTHTPVEKTMKISELEKSVSFINWKKYFRQIIPTSMKTLESDDVVVLSDWHYFDKLSKLVNELLQGQSDDKIKLKNFLVWRTVERMIGYLPKTFEDARREQLRKTGNSAMERSSWSCAELTNAYFGFATAAVFARKMFHTDSSNMVRLMFSNLKDAFTRNLESLPLDHDNMKILKNKSDTMGLLIGFPKFILNATELDNYYSSVNVHEDAFFNNILEAQVKRYQRQFKLLGQNPNKASWPFHHYFTPLGMNAVYCKEINQIVMTMGILQHPDLQHKQLTPSNFGTLGSVLAHEFMHAFVNKELCSGAVNGWPKQIQEMFQDIHSCVSKHYSNCSSPQYCRTLNEDMADISGMKLAYSAFLNWQEKQQQPTTKQQFFSAYVQMWCSNGENSQKSAYSPIKKRGSKPLSYMPDFAHEFDCKPDPQLNPQNRCSVF